MKTIAELNKERITIRLTDSDKSKALTALIDYATKFAKNQKREPTYEDIQVAAVAITKEIKGDIAIVEKELDRLFLVCPENTTKALDYKDSIAVYKRELPLYEEFLPKMLDEQAIMTWLEKFSEDELVSSNFGKIMKEAKAVEGMDCGLLSTILKKKLK